MSQQPPEKAYTPPGAAPPQVPGQYAHEYPNQHGSPQPPQYGPNHTPAQPQPQYPQGQYAQTPSPHQQQNPGQYAQTPNPHQQQNPGQYPAQQPYPAQGQYPPGQYPVQQPPQMAQAGYPGQPQFQQQANPTQAQPGPTIIVQQQPLPIIGMSISAPGGNRNARNLPRDASGRRGWSFGLCECFDSCGACVLGWCCPCLLYAQLKQRVDYLNMYARPDPSQGGSGIDLNCMIWCGLHLTTGCGYALQAITRGQIRNRYMIEGNGVADFCTACFCTPCQLTQEHRELELEEKALSMGPR
ncbi:PLAC8 family-domain-containing protein [Amanita rubescens]|nr:PLAC8 family-domain-containing protein [Amanita rubescens]